MLALLIALTFAADDDLRDLRIPADAIARPGSFKPGRTVKKKLDYFVGANLVGARLFYADGQIADEKLYRNGKLHGIWRQYWPDGRLFAERPYRDGQMDGVFRFWDRQGKLVRESEMKRGTGLLKELGNPALLSDDAETHYANGKKDGLQTRWGRFEACTGLGYSISSYKNDRLDGWMHTRDEDGTILAYACGRNGKLHGVFRKFDREGQPLKGYPQYFINGEEVTEERFLDAAKTDRVLAEALAHSPPRTETPPPHDASADE